MNSLQSTASNLKLAMDGLKTLLALKVTAETQAKIVDVQSAIISAQQENMTANEERAALLQRVGELEKQVAQMKAWEAEAERYDLKRFQPDTLAYAVKESARNGEPMHLLCARCFQEQRKSMLQWTDDRGMGGRIYACATCRAKYTLENYNGYFHPFQESTPPA